MPQFMISVLDETTGSATAEEMDAIREFNTTKLKGEGHWVLAGGLAAPDSAQVIDNRGAKPLITQGPFAETKEYVGGLWVIEADDLDQARELAELASRACNRRLELRAFL